MGGRLFSLVLTYIHQRRDPFFTFGGGELVPRQKRVGCSQPKMLYELAVNLVGQFFSSLVLLLGFGLSARSWTPVRRLIGHSVLVSRDAESGV